MQNKIRIFLSKNVVFNNKVQPAILIIKNGKIEEILENVTKHKIVSVLQNYPGIVIEDFGSLVIMPGIVDSHVHINEPGRTEWEGFRTATRAAAVGGITTIADMPLNSIPPTTTVDNLKTKADKARDMIYVDLAFWGGIIPGNQNELQPLVEAGVVGFKCFLCPSGVDEFPCVKEDDVNKALEKLKSTRSVLAFHAEYVKKNTVTSAKGDPTCYETFLRTRPSEMEINAIKMICHWCEKSNVRCHIVHLSTADALDLIKATKGKGAPITAETCHHYLLLSAEEVPVCATEFKCCPPIRDKVNRDKLWDGLRNKVIDMVVSDHSPCTEELKTKGNFLTAWGGISSLQFGLSLLWTAARLKSVGLTEISRLLSAAPAKLCGLNDRKGTLSVGMDADFVIWDPEKMFKVERNHILFKNKLTPYENRILYGKVEATVLRGEYIFKDNQLCEKPVGNLLLKKNFLD
ncbi:PREDICTED: allantoinase [Habropoda laboriosa]|uniref:allantoinase n=1 Tax=Habropoda laboriosa TaxID=597456 RepID=UPI00083E6A13|nr:PREDICTED: allantoinase [Habropoda laboriosa]